MCSQVLAWGPAFLNVTLHHFALTHYVHWVRAHNPMCDSQQFYFPVSRIFECNFMIDSMYHQPCQKKKKSDSFFPWNILKHMSKSNLFPDACVQTDTQVQN